MTTRIHAEPFDPREHPDYERRHVKPPSFEELGNCVHFAGLRGFEVVNGSIMDLREKLDRYTGETGIADAVWPSYPVLFADNLIELVDEIRRRDLYLFDIWGYVPGSGAGGYWKQFHVDRAVLEMLETELGDRWLGMDVGEQDGRYVLAYVSQMDDPGACRTEQYLNFQRHIQRICDENGNRMVALLAITLGHYELKEGGYTFIGAETAQMHPNSQVFYSFIRGAGKQYGVPWYGNASVYNRWGYKTYGSSDPTVKQDEIDAVDHGPTKGSSLSLLRRLIFQHILYNCWIVGFEQSWFEHREVLDIHGIPHTIETDVLSPIGRIQKSARDFIRTHGLPGTMVTSVAVMSGFDSGWTFPNYNYQLYRVWGNRPYEACDHFQNGILDLFYPGYQNSSFFHDETGFIAPTPYGDTVDCILSDAETWLLERYPVLIVAGKTEPGLELLEKLSNYLRHGGTLVLTAGNPHLVQGLTGEAPGELVRIPEKSVIVVDGDPVTEETGFDAAKLPLQQGARILASLEGLPLAVESSIGDGTLVVLASPFGIGAAPSEGLVIRCDEDHPLPNPYPLLRHVCVVLDGILRRQILFTAGEGLSLVVCRKGTGRYTLGICNNTLGEKRLEILSRIGRILSIREMEIVDPVDDCRGYLPEGLERSEIGRDDAGTIAGGSTRLFDVCVEESGVQVIPHVLPPPRPSKLACRMAVTRSIQEEILLKPTFFEHFDSLVVEGSYLLRTESCALKRESLWLVRQGIRLVVDLSGSLNLYPDLRLTDNDRWEYERSMAAYEEVLGKMEILGARDLIIKFHRAPENNFTNGQTESSLLSTLSRLCDRASPLGITIHVRMGMTDPDAVRLDPATGVGKASLNFYDLPYAALDRMLAAVGRENLKIAASTAVLLASGLRTVEGIRSASFFDRVGLWLLASSAKDITDRPWTLRAPLLDDAEGFKGIAGILGGRLRVLDCDHRTLDGIFRDAVLAQEVQAIEQEGEADHV